LQRELFDQFVKPGLAQMIAARDLCPLLPKAQARLAAYAIGGQPDGGIAMAQSDPPSAYWARALALAPYDADLLYYAGQLAFQNGRFDDAWGYWKKSLERRPTHVRAIVEAAAPKLRADGLLERVMPDDTRCLLEAARILAADPSQTSEQRKILDKIKSLLTSDLTVNADSTYQLAVTYRMLGETDNALSQFRTLLVLAPDRGEWRYEYAELLYSLQTNASKQEALQQLNMALLTNPSHIAAQNLRGTITRELKR
jgi:tetratricopeptide (TPR) repeat protein